MNRKRLVLSVLPALLLFCSNVFANSIDYISNASADFLMNQSRNAATDSATIVAYNPAGTALMAPGLYFSASAQGLYPILDEEFTAPNGIDEKYKDRELMAVPHAYMVYNMGNVGDGNLALSMKAGVIASGGMFKWDGTTAVAYTGSHAAQQLTAGKLTTTLTSTDVDHTVSSAYYGLGGNAAYSMFNNRVSVSAGAQGIIAKDTSEMSGKLNYNTAAFGGAWSMNIDSDFTRDAKGYNLIFGLDARPVEKLTIGLRYETEAALKFKYDQTSNVVTPSALKNNPTIPVAPGVSTDGNHVVAGASQKVANDAFKFEGKTNYNLPAVFGYGLEYQLTPELMVATGGTLYFLQTTDMDGLEDHFKKVGYELNIGGTYAIIPSLKLGMGVTIADVGGKESLKETEVRDEMAFQGSKDLINKVIMGGLGATYTVIPNLDLTLSYAYLTSDKEKATTESGYDVTYYRGLHLVGLQASYKFF